MKTTHPFVRVCHAGVIAGLFICSGLCVVGATNTAPEKTAVTQSKTAWNLFATGGMLMYPLAVCSCAVVGLTVYQARELRRSRIVPARDSEALRSFMYTRDTSGAYAYCRQNSGFLTNVFAAGVLRLDSTAADNGKPAAENAIADAIDNQETRMSFWLNMISVIAAVSPMVGLLGTVNGMIKAFQKIGMGGMGKPEQLAGNIGEALITTAAGLVVGIPAMLAFFILRGKLDSLLTRVTETVTTLIDSYTGENNARQLYEAKISSMRQETQPMQYQPVPQPAPENTFHAEPLSSQITQNLQRIQNENK